MGINKYFSERHGYKPSRLEIQLTYIDNALLVAIWNTIYETFFQLNRLEGEWIQSNEPLGILVESIWKLYFKFPLDKYENEYYKWVQLLKDHLFSCAWYEVYDLLEFMIGHWPSRYDADYIFTPAFNHVLEREMSGYRIIDGFVTPITDEMEIAEIEEVLSITHILKPVRIQLEDALRKMSNRQDPDYRGSMKDSISALETLCRRITGEPKGDLGKTMKLLEEKGHIRIHGALREGFSKLYGWTSDDQGIRHALMDEPNLTFLDAKYMLVSCSAFINYLVGKAAVAGIDLQP